MVASRYGDWTLNSSDGTALVWPAVEKGYSRTLARVGGSRTYANGGYGVDTIAKKRTWNFTFTELTETEFADLHAFWDGRRGDLPFTLHDPNTNADGTLGADYTVVIDSFDDVIANRYTQDQPRHTVQIVLIEL